MKKQAGKRKEYRKPDMTVLRINRFFLGGCQNIWPNCYSLFLFIPGAARCR
ncbi:hypothetical protein [Candidatus Solincola tengchongensis]|uniref:hypothetical protein n=1 Tax=Candidatus Solincola tengchongensis TaxID=2900693 RepID=UPI00258070E9|nr:hypothetical protein [Candidatus Solincola tengchongensis]